MGGSSATGGSGSASYADIVSQGIATTTVVERPAYGALISANDGLRSYVVESRRDVEPGPVGLPWRSRFRLAAYDDGAETWSYEANPDDLIGDVVIHPSGDITMTVEHWSIEHMAYDLVRLAPDGKLIVVTTLSQPITLPSSDFGPNDPQPLFRMKSDLADATTAGWVRLIADGEGAYAAFLSFVQSPAGQPSSNRMALGLAAYSWSGGAYNERWARVVEGSHTAQPAAWAYDELRWREQAVRPFLARDATEGSVYVGRAWNNSRCRANLATFAEFTAEQCVLDAGSTFENERLPLAVTRFDPNGARLGTVVLQPDIDAAEQVAFDLRVQGEKIAVVGSVVRTLLDGAKRTYPDATGFVDYDGYVAIYDAHGSRVLSHDFNQGRGDVLAAMRWTSDGILAVGSAGWDRWQGGMSISRGADPLFAWLSLDGTQATSRTLALTDGTRHFNLHDVAIADRNIVGFGFSDAPMTHSADGDNTAARTFGALRIKLQ